MSFKIAFQKKKKKRTTVCTKKYDSLLLFCTLLIWNSELYVVLINQRIFFSCIDSCTLVKYYIINPTQKFQLFIYEQSKILFVS